MGLPWWRKHIRPIASAGIGVVVTFVAAIIARKAADEQESLRFSQRAGVAVVGMRTALDAPAEVAAMVPPFFDASTEVSRQDFAIFTRPALATRPGVLAVEWFPHVTGEERAAVEARARAEGVTGYEFREPDSLGRMVRSPPRGDYIAMAYMQPPNNSVLGLDLGFDPVRRGMAARAARTGQTLVSQRFRLVEDRSGPWSLSLYAPVYAPGLPRDTEAQRETAWRGIVTVLFRPELMVAPALRHINVSERDVAVVDEDVPASESVIFESTPGAAARAHTASLRWSQPYTFCDHRWRFLYAARVSPPMPKVVTAAVLAVGFLLTVVVTLALGAWTAIARLRRQVTTAMTLGAYTLEDRLGEGGMGVVYRAKHSLLRRPTAVKVLNPERTTDEFIQRFEREVRATSELTHPNTISVYDFGRSPDGTFYYAMEYLDGINLEELIARFGPVPAARAAFIMRQVCSALAEAHSHAMVHRDIKPANIMLCVRGGLHDFVKVLDFGLVKDLGPASAKLSSTDAFIGTPLYMAPEAMSATKDVGPASDLYAIGGVLYFLLTGHAPFERDNLVDLCSAHLSSPAPTASARSAQPVPPSMDKLVMRCMAKNPAQRPTSAKALADAFASLEDLPTRWTEADAAAWWEAHSPLFRKPKAAPQPNERPAAR